MKRFNSALIFILLEIFLSVVKASDPRLCPKTKLPCDDELECIANTKWCDGNFDCEDESDEDYCKLKRFFEKDPNDCSKTHFLCDDGKCFPKEAACDGYKNCKNGEDEENCDDEFEITTLQPFLQTSKPTNPTKRSIGKNADDNDDDDKAEEEKEENENDNNNKKNDTDSSSSEEESDETENNGGNSFKVNEIDVRSSQEKKKGQHTKITTSVFKETNGNSVNKGITWLFSMRDEDHDWDQSTCRALIALGLVNPEKFSHADEDAMLMQKQLAILLAMDLFRNQSQPISLSRLSFYINAMLATCQNPENFHGINLVQELRIRTSVLQKSQYTTREFISPIVYLTLCLTDQTSHHDIFKLMEILRMRSGVPGFQDLKVISVMALSCIEKYTQYQNSYANELLRTVTTLIPRINKGDIGNIYSTALAAQALLSTATSDKTWKKQQTIQFLQQHQQQNGSFGDILATYYILPVLAKKSLLDLRSLSCQHGPKMKGVTPLERLRNSQGDKINVRYALYINSPPKIRHTIEVHVPGNTSFFNIMKLAESDDSKFRFLYERDEEDSVNIYSIGNIPNDAERGYYWQLHMVQQHVAYRRVNDFSSYQNIQLVRNPVNKLYPKNNDFLIFWYKLIGSDSR